MIEIPRLNFAHLPTRVESLARLATTLDGPEVMIKRDDQTGLAFGGNKTRKLEFLVAEAQAMGARTLITAGAVQSNHCRQTAAAAARFGLDCILVLAGAAPERASANFLLSQLLGAEVVWAEWDTRHEALQKAYEAAKDAGNQPYLVPYGGSSPTGACGYVFAIQELMEQEIQADWVVFPSSSGGTHAGLVVGARMFGFGGKILGISIDENEQDLKVHVARLASDTAAHLGEDFTFEPDDILVNADYCEAGYGVLTEKEVEAIYLFASLEGMLLDPVYTGRAAAGMIDLIRRGVFNRNESVLFWHTGGTPALFAEKYMEFIHPK
ncbi:MAG: D-cysteine desulfhydrase family protein [Anaerolineales bacterium]|nr:D-cysteine desulfhydrase family protein [Anaerolineales bacterium]